MHASALHALLLVTKHRSMPSNAEDIETDDPMTVDGEEAHEVAMNLIALQSQ